MTFPIHPNNYQSQLPAPHQPDESSAFSEGIRRVKLLRSAQFECATLALVWIDLALVTHQIVLDYSLSAARNDSESSNLSDWTVGLQVFANNHPALDHQASMALFITITTMSFMFLLEGIVRNVYSRISQRRFFALNVIDAILSGISFVLNVSLLIARINPLARDIVALIVALRLMRTAALFGGLTRSEKQQILHLLEDYRREESYRAENQRMLQTELANCTKECQDLRELIKSATLARNRLKQKQQLQVKQNEETDGSTKRVSGDGGGDGGVNGTDVVVGRQDDSGHSSDSSPDLPVRDAFGTMPSNTGSSRDGGSSGDSGPQSNMELASVTLEPDNSSNNRHSTSRM